MANSAKILLSLLFILSELLWVSKLLGSRRPGANVCAIDSFLITDTVCDILVCHLPALNVLPLACLIHMHLIESCVTTKV